MVDEYSNQPLQDSEISASNYSEEGFVPRNVGEQVAAAKLEKSGFTPATVNAMGSRVGKEMAVSAAAKRKKKLKILLLQWVNKYLSNPQKYRDHPKQIRDKPSWFDDAIVLFNDGEMTREQKQYLREYLYGLIQYRDTELARRKLGDGEEYVGPDVDESERQLGRQSPYNIEENQDVNSIKFPRERELARFNPNEIAQNVQEGKLPRQEQSVEEIINTEPGQSVDQIQAQSFDNGMGIVKVAPVSTKRAPAGLDDYIFSGKKAAPVTTRSSSQVSPALQATQSKPRINTSALVGMMGGFSLGAKPSTPVSNIVAGATNQRKKKSKMVKIKRRKLVKHKQKSANMFGIQKFGVQQSPVSRGIELPKIKVKTGNLNISKFATVELPKIRVNGQQNHTIRSTAIEIPKIGISNKGNGSVGKFGSIELPKIRVDSNTSSILSRNKVTQKSNGKKATSNSQIARGNSQIARGNSQVVRGSPTALNLPNVHAMMNKQKNSLDQAIPKRSICDMDTLFKHIKHKSVNEFGKQNMKMEILDNIRDQCGKALASNNFKREAIKMKTTYFAEAKATAPRVDINLSRGNNKIHETDMLVNITKNHIASADHVKRGSLKPRNVGITKYDFNLGSIYNQPKEEGEYYSQYTPIDNPMVANEDGIDQEYEEK